MRALTICQPYAELICRGVKRVENRTWPTSYRGALAIHAGKSHQWLDLDETGLRDRRYGIPLSEMVFGAVVAVCDLVDCLSYSAIRDHSRKYPWIRDHKHTEGPWCWVLSNVRRLATPVPYKGSLGLFDVPNSLVDSLGAA